MVEIIIKVETVADAVSFCTMIGRPLSGVAIEKTAAKRGRKPLQPGEKPFLSGYRNKKAWTQYDNDFLVTNWPVKTTAWIAKQLSKTKPAVMSQVHRLRKQGIALVMKKNRTKNLK